MPLNRTAKLVTQTGTSIPTFEQEINNMLAAGWELYGSPFASYAFSEYSQTSGPRWSVIPFLNQMMIRDH